MFMSALLPGFGTIVPRVWAGEGDVTQLTKELSQGQHDDLKPIIAACVQQLCSCFEALVEEHGHAEANSAVARKLLVRTTEPIAMATAYAREAV